MADGLQGWSRRNVSCFATKLEYGVFCFLVDADGTARQDFCDKDGRSRLKLYVKPDGTPHQDFNDMNGQRLVSYGLLPDGKVSLRLLSKLEQWCFVVS